MKKAITTLAMCCIGTILQAQLHLNIGVVDVEDRMDASTTVWEAGYTQFFDRLGTGLNVRYTSMSKDNYYTSELFMKYRFVDNLYRLDLALGGGFNFDDKDVHPILGIRNSLRIGDGTWINLGLDNAYRNSKDLKKEGWRFETYLMVGVSLDVLRIGKRNFRKIKSVF